MSRDFLVALNGLRQEDPTEPLPAMRICSFLGIDAFEVVVCLTELMEQDLVTVPGNLDGHHLMLNDPHTDQPLVLTAAGRAYLAEVTAG